LAVNPLQTRRFQDAGLFFLFNFPAALKNFPKPADKYSVPLRKEENGIPYFPNDAQRKHR
jgi:hypothetical protein